MKKMKEKEFKRRLKLGQRSFKECGFESIDFKAYDLYKVVFSDCEFLHCLFDKSMIRAVEFNHCCFIEVHFQECEIESVAFLWCHFTDLSIHKSVIRDTDVKGSMFQNSEFHSVSFHHTDVYDSTFANTTLEKTTFQLTSLSESSFTHTEGIEVFQVGDVGTFDGIVTYVPEYNKVFAGCWKGSAEDFLIRCEMVKYINIRELNLDIAVYMVKSVAEQHGKNL